MQALCARRLARCWSAPLCRTSLRACSHATYPLTTPLTPLAQEGQEVRLAATEDPATEPAATTKEPAVTKKPVAAVKEETTCASCPGQPEGSLDAVRW